MQARIAIVAVLAAGLAKAADSGAAKAVAPFDAAAAWKKTCAMCHGPAGHGSEKMAKMLKAEPAALDLTTAEVAKKADADLVKIVTDGSPTNKKMAAYGKKFKPTEIDALVALVRGFAKSGTVPAAAPSPTK